MTPEKIEITRADIYAKAKREFAAEAEKRFAPVPAPTAITGTQDEIARALRAATAEFDAQVVERTNKINAWKAENQPRLSALLRAAADELAPDFIVEVHGTIVNMVGPKST